MEIKNFIKDLKGLLGEFWGQPTVELFNIHLAGLSAEDGERHLLGFCKLAFGYYEELLMGRQKLVDGYLDGERGEDLMMWYLIRHTPWENTHYELHRPDLFLRMAKLAEFADRDGHLPYSRLVAYLCTAFFIRSLLDPNSGVLSRSLADRLSALDMLPNDILELARKGEVTDEI